MDFKEIQNTYNDSFERRKPLEPAQIEALLKIKRSSNTALSRLKKSHEISIMVATVLFLGIIAGMIILVKMPALILWGSLVMVLLGTVYYFALKSYFRIKKTSITDERVKQALTRTITEVEKNLKFGTGNLYKYLLIPLAIVLGMAIGIYIGSGERSFLETVLSLETKSIIKIIVVFFAGSGITIMISQSMMKQVYRPHLDELRSCLSDFEENNITNLNKS